MRTLSFLSALSLALAMDDSPCLDTSGTYFPDPEGDL
jgi:hypothetical protein